MDKSAFVDEVQTFQQLLEEVAADRIAQGFGFERIILVAYVAYIVDQNSIWDQIFYDIRHSLPRAIVSIIEGVIIGSIVLEGVISYDVGMRTILDLSLRIVCFSCQNF